MRYRIPEVVAKSMKIDFPGSISIKTQQFDIDDAGYFTAPDSFGPDVAHLGFQAAPELNFPLDEEGLRTDGLTLSEWLKAGNDEKDYPPKGFAAKLATPGKPTFKPDAKAK